MLLKHNLTGNIQNIEIITYAATHALKYLILETTQAVTLPEFTPEERAEAEAWLRNYPPCQINELMREAQDTGTPNQFWHWLGDGT